MRTISVAAFPSISALTASPQAYLCIPPPGAMYVTDTKSTALLFFSNLPASLDVIGARVFALYGSRRMKYVVGFQFLVSRLPLRLASNSIDAMPR